MMRSKIIYRLTIEDIQIVATGIIRRELTNSEIQQITEVIGDNMPWYDVISHILFQKFDIYEKED